MDFITAALNPVLPAPEKKAVPASGFYLVNDDKVNVRGTPDEKNGAIVVQVNKGLRVEVLEVTDQMYTIDGALGYWYRLKEPSGWVFGSFLTKE